FQAEDGIRDFHVTGVQRCALPISRGRGYGQRAGGRMRLELCRYIESLPPAEHGRSVTIGAFDGLHLGHREILARLVDDARSAGRPALVCSFEPTPAEALSPDDPPARLTCFRERFELLDAAGVDEFFCARFRKLRRLEPRAFVEEVLVAR